MDSKRFTKTGQSKKFTELLKVILIHIGVFVITVLTNIANWFRKVFRKMFKRKNK